MENNLEDLMGHIDYFYEHIKSTYDDDLKYTVYLKDKVWKITNSKDEENLETEDHKEAMRYLVENNADLLTLHALIHSNVCTSGVLKRRQLKEITELVGSDAIDENEAGWAKFAEGLSSLIGTAIEEKEKPALTMVEL